MESTADYIGLLLGRKLDEVYGIAAHADGQLGIVLRMLLCVQQSVSVEYVYIQMMAALGCISVQKVYEIVYLCCVCHNFALHLFIDNSNDYCFLIKEYHFFYFMSMDF